MRLFEQAQGFACLARLAEAVTGSLALDEVLDCVVRAANDLVGDSSARIWVLQEDRLLLRAEAGTRGAAGAGRKTVIAVGEGLIGHVARTGQALVLADVLADPRTVNVEWMRAQGFVCYVGLPLAVRGRLLGVLSLHVRRAHRFSPEEMDLLGAFGTQAAIAINNACLFEETQARRRRAEALARAARTLTERLDVAAVGARIVASVEPLFGVPHALLAWLGPGATIVPVATSPDLRGVEPGAARALGAGLLARAVAERQPFPASATADEAELRAATGLRAIAAAPLVARGRTIAVLLIGDTTPRAFDDGDLTLLGTFADHAGLALENARLYEEARDARDFMHSVAANSADAIVTTDTRGRITYFSPGAEEMFGYAPIEVLGRPLDEYRHPGREELQALMEQLKERGRIRSYETTIRARDGRRVDVNASLSLLRDTHGTTIGMVVVIRDVSERRWVEQELARDLVQIARLNQEVQEREAFIRNVVDNLGEGLLVVDGDGRVLAWNRAMSPLCGIAADDAIGHHYAALLAGADARVTDAVARLLSGAAETVTVEAVEHPGPHGERRVLNVKGRRLCEDDRPCGAVLLVEDATDAVALARTARQTEKMAALGTLCAGTAHEINNPIGIITSRIELMLAEADRHRLPDTVRQDLAVVHRSAQRVARITQGLLSFARQSRGTLAALDLNRVIRDTLVLVESQMAKEGIRIGTRIEPTLPPLLGDANALQQVLLNLLTNSREAMEGQGGRIDIETTRVAGASPVIRLVVSDTGCGISAEEMPRIFDPFHTTKERGTGLGLSVSHGIIRDHHGTVEVQSEPGKGTTFVVTFPALRLEDQARPAPALA